MEKKEFTSRIVPMDNWILRIAFHILRNKEDARDTRQEVFVRLWIVRSELDQCRSLEAFANRTTQFFCIDKLRKEHYRRRALQHLALHQETATAGESSHDRIYIFLKIREIAETLPPAMRDTFLLREIEGLEYQEIADKYGMSLNWAHHNISRARKIMVEEILKLRLHEYYRN